MPRRTISTPPWTGCSGDRRRSNPSWQAATSNRAARCCTTCPRATSRARIAPWLRSATAGTARRASRRSTTAWSSTAKAVPCRSPVVVLADPALASARARRVLVDGEAVEHAPRVESPVLPEPARGLEDRAADPDRPPPAGGRGRSGDLARPGRAGAVRGGGQVVDLAWHDTTRPPAPLPAASQLAASLPQPGKRPTDSPRMIIGTVEGARMRLTILFALLVLLGAAGCVAPRPQSEDPTSPPLRVSSSPPAQQRPPGIP